MLYKRAMLKLAKDLSLPLDVVTQTITIIAKRRAGKSYTARRMVEELFRVDQQIVVVDPKGDWWGIRSSADGKSPGLPVVIIGGEHGDVALETGAGAVVAKLVVEERASALLDLSFFRKGEVAQFMAAFLETLYRLKAKEEYRTPMMLAIDEADAIAPQRPFKGEERMLGAAEDIVRRGGQRGIGCLLVTQRSAVLNKNLLTQSQIIVALRTIAPQDIAALDAWIEVHGTAEQRDTFLESLASLPTGDAWFWSPGWPTETGIFKRVHVLGISTFDSGATPRPGERRTQPKNLADINLEALKRQMAATIEKVKGEDPRELKKQIADLRRQLAARRDAGPQIETKRVEVPVIKDSQAKALETLFGRIIREAERHGKAMAIFWENQNEVATALLNAMREVEKGSLEMGVAAGISWGTEVKKVKIAAASNGDAILGKCEAAILATLAQHGECDIGRLALLSGYRRSGGFKNSISKLRGLGYLEGPNTGTMRITEAGLTSGEFAALPTGRDLFDYWINSPRMGVCERKIMEVLDGKRTGLTLVEIAEISGYATSGGFKNSLSKLRTAGVIVGRNTERMMLDEELRG